MKENSIRYDQWIEDSLRNVVVRALKEVQENGFPGEHHFYITFLTEAEGVKIPGHLKIQYPKEMTIVLQNQYENLIVSADTLEVTLRFDGKGSHLRIPISAITIFTDPSVNFGLQFKGGHSKDSPAQKIEASPDQENEGQKEANTQEADPLLQQTGEIITLDAFRKK